MHKARKRFGQHFLVDQTIIHRIVSAIGPKPNQAMIEIGPGLGALTQILLPEVQVLTAIELDRDVIPHLQKLCASLGELTVHQTDVLKFDFSQCDTSQGQLRIVGNLPYNISTPILFHLFKYSDRIQDMHFMLQKEVVKRMCASPGDSAYGRLSVMVQYYSEVEALFDIGPQAFDPPPKVDSAIVKLMPYQQKPCVAKDEALLSKLVALAFMQRRKTLRNSLKTVVDADTLEVLGINPQLRPDAVAVKDYVAIANHLAGQ